MGIGSNLRISIPTVVAALICASAPMGYALPATRAGVSVPSTAAAAAPAATTLVATRTWAARLARIKLPSPGGPIAVTPNGKRLFVGTESGTLAISTRTRKVVGTLPFTGSFVLTSTGHRIMGFSASSAEFVRYDTATLQMTRQIPLAGLMSEAHGVLLDATGNTAYVCGRVGGPGPGEGSAAVVAIDLLTNTPRAVLQAASPYLYSISCAAVHPSATRLYVIADEQLQALDVATGVLTPIDYVEHYATIAFDATGTRAYMADWHIGRVVVIDTTTDAVLRAIPVPTYPSDILLSATGGLMYVLEEMDGPGVLAIDLATDAVIRVAAEKKVCASTGCRPTGMALSGSGARMYVTSGDASVAVLGLALRPPSAPRKVAASVTADGVTVTWSTPKRRGGSRIQGYVVTALPTGRVCTTSTRTCTFTDLPPGVTHTLQVRARNRDGMGSPGHAAPLTF